MQVDDEFKYILHDEKQIEHLEVDIQDETIDGLEIDIGVIDDEPEFVLEDEMVIDIGDELDDCDDAEWLDDDEQLHEVDEMLLIIIDVDAVDDEIDVDHVAQLQMQQLVEVDDDEHIIIVVHMLNDEID